MRVLILAVLLAACGSAEPNEYPANARAAFARSCPTGDPMCDCTWDKVTRSMTHEEYDAALKRYRSEGLMDPRIARARTECLERHGR